MAETKEALSQLLRITKCRHEGARRDQAVSSPQHHAPAAAAGAVTP